MNENTTKLGSPKRLDPRIAEMRRLANFLAERNDARVKAEKNAKLGG
jgi:hypothetical protein